MANTPGTIKPVDLGFTPVQDPRGQVLGAQLDIDAYLATYDPGTYPVADLYAAYREADPMPVSLTTFVRCAREAGWYRYRTASQRYLVKPT